MVVQQPAAQISPKDKYGFDPTPAWLEHVQKSSVRFNSGGSGSFVSPDGLVMTNHHVGADALQKMSDKDHNYLRDGFYAIKRQTDESTDVPTYLELNVLMSIEDVTAFASTPPSLPGLPSESSPPCAAAWRWPRSRRNRSTKRACAATS